MKTRVVLALLIHLIVGGTAVAEKLDLSAHDAIIQKLESAASISGEDSMVQHVELTHRLADLYAERARLLSMEDEGRGAQTFSEKIVIDRQKSITTLKKILNALDKSEKGPVLLQISHLHELLGQNSEALKIYKQIERNPEEFDNKSKSLTEIKLGDFSFAASDLSKAQEHFEKSISYSENPRKSYSYYRLAWVHFNLGETVIAEKKMLKLLQTPALFKTSAGLTDEAFVEEATHDLATFIARNDLTQTSLKTFILITPDKLRKKNLIYLAQELDRTSKKQSALKVWAIIGTQNLTFEDQIERQIQITRIEYDISQFSSLLSEITKSIILLKKPTCNENPTCTLARENLRRIITDWARAEERKVSAEVIKAFGSYTQSFDDYEMNFWAAGLSRKRLQHQDAFTFYSRSSALLKDVKPKNAQQQKLFEASLVGGIEMAEFAKDPQMKLQAFNRYLEFNPRGPQNNEVKYQVARWYYEQNNYVTAHSEFKKLALDKTMTTSLKEKSGDLCLDTNVLLKDEVAIEKDSLELSEQLPSKRNEYLAVWRKSILNQTATLLNAKPSDPQLQAEFIKLNRVDARSFQNEEKLQLIKNKLEISYRLNDLDSLIQFSKLLLEYKKLNSNDQQKVLHYLAWAAEIRMNFKESLKYMRLIKPNSKNLPDYYLKVALLKELSNQNPTAEYDLFLSVSREKQKSRYAAHQIILNSRNPMKAFRKYETILNKDIELFSSAALFVYEKTKDPTFTKRILSIKTFKNTLSGDLVRHQSSFNDFKIIAKRLSSEKFKSTQDSQVKRALIRRNDLIHQIEQLTNKSIAKQDTVEQLIFLPFLAAENKRLALEILALPQPRKLSKLERTQYEEQLKLLVAPYQKQGLAIESKVNELWKQNSTQDLLAQLSKWSTQINRPGHQLASQELSLLRGSVQSLGLNSGAFEKLSERSQKVSKISLEAVTLQQRIYKNPFDSSNLEKMKQLQISLGSGPMVAYIDSRMSELNSRGR